MTAVLEFPFRLWACMAWLISCTALMNCKLLLFHANIEIRHDFQGEEKCQARQPNQNVMAGPKVR